MHLKHLLYCLTNKKISTIDLRCQNYVYWDTCNHLYELNNILYHTNIFNVLFKFFKNCGIKLLCHIWVMIEFLKCYTIFFYNVGNSKSQPKDRHNSPSFLKRFDAFWTKCSGLFDICSRECKVIFPIKKWKSKSPCSCQYK